MIRITEKHEFKIGMEVYGYYHDEYFEAFILPFGNVYFDKCKVRKDRKEELKRLLWEMHRLEMLIRYDVEK